jgi:MoxR-like ATPase
MALFAAAMEAAAATEGGGRGAPLSYPATTAAAPAARILQTFPRESAGAVLSRAYPYAATEARLAKAVGTLSGGPFESSRRAFLRVCDELGISSSTQEPAYEIESISPVTGDPFHVKVHFKCALPESGTSSLSTLWGRQEEGRVIVRVPSGGKLMEKEETSPPLPGTVNSFVPTDASAVVLVGMMQEHFAGRDMLLVSPKGEGKSVVARQFAGCLGYSVHVMHLFREMTALDLLARRGTDAVTGETVWTESPLVQAARTGQICLLDGIEKLRPDTLGTLQRLLTDREVCLPDGTTLALAPSRQDGSSSSSSTNVIHPSFRVIGLASISSDHSPSFLTEEVVSMFSTISLPAPGRTCLKEILSPSNAYSEGDLDNILDFHETLLSNDTASECGVSPLSIRTLLRLLKRGSVGADVHESICSALLADLLPPTQRASLESVLKGCGIKSKRATSRPKRGTEATEIKVSTESISIEDFTMERKRPRHAELVPSPHFFDIPSHVQMIKTLLGEWTVGERSFLLLGNQGTGKNKICDRICELAGFEREYLQLHRDSTIGQLTLSPSIEDGKIVWRDSPLVRAVTEGRALVIDEADKAPLEVVSVLKSLVEDGELLLADGRRILRDSTNYDKGKGVRRTPFCCDTQLLPAVLTFDSFRQMSFLFIQTSLSGSSRIVPGAFSMEMTSTVKLVTASQPTLYRTPTWKAK